MYRMHRSTVNPNPRRSQRARKPTFGNDGDYIVYIQEAEFDLGDDNDPATFNGVIESDQSSE